MALESDQNADKAILKFESMLKTDDVYFFDAEDFEEIIHHYLNLGKIALAKKAIQIGLQQHPVSFEIRLLKVEVLVFEDHFKEAENILDQLAEQNPIHEEICIQRANILSKQDDHLGAIQMLLKALSMADDCFDIYSLLGMEYLFLDNYEQAKENFIKCLEYDDQDYASLYNVIYCFEFLEDYDGAIEYLNGYLENHPYCEVAWHQLGKMYIEKNLLKEAYTAFDFAIISDDQFIGAYFEKGKVLEKMGRYNEAIENYETTLKIDDPTSHAYLRIGKCHEKLGNFDLAKYYYYNTVHEDPLLDKGWLSITQFYFRQKDYNKALHYINKALNIDGENPIYWKKAARIYTALKRYDEADFAFKQAINYGNYELDTWKDWATTLCQINEFDDAAEVLLQGLEFYEEEATLLYQLAGVYIKSKKTDLAKEKMRRALQSNSKKAVLFFKMYPEFTGVTWVNTLLKAFKKAST